MIKICDYLLSIHHHLFESAAKTNLQIRNLILNLFFNPPIYKSGVKIFKSPSSRTFYSTSDSLFTISFNYSSHSSLITSEISSKPSRPP